MEGILISLVVTTGIIFAIGLKLVLNLFKKRGKNYTKVEAIEIKEKRATYSRRWFAPTFEYTLQGKTCTYRSEALFLKRFNAMKTTLYINNETGAIVSKAQIIKRILMSIFCMMFVYSFIIVRNTHEIMMYIFKS